MADPASTMPPDASDATRSILAAIERIHQDLDNIKEAQAQQNAKQTEILTRLAVGGQTLDQVKDLPIRHAILEQRVDTIEKSHGGRIKAIEDIVAAVVWKVLSYTLGAVSLIAVVGSVAYKALHP